VADIHRWERAGRAGKGWVVEAPQTEQAVQQPPLPRHHWGVARGERIVVSAGLAVAAVVVGVLLACAWFTLDTLRQHVERARSAQISMLSQMIGAHAEATLTETEWTSLRRLVADSARIYGLARCQIVLGDGTIIADADPSRISPRVPSTWPPLAVTEEPLPARGEIHLHTPILVRGKGQALLEVSGTVQYPVWADWEVQAGLGAIGAGAMAGLLLVYRTMRHRWRALGAVGDALRWEASGKATPGSLWINEAFGPEAKAWNALVSERDRLREALGQTRDAPVNPGQDATSARLGTALDALWQGLLILDANGVVLYANGAAGVLLKKRREDLNEARTSDLLPDPEFTSALADMLEGRGAPRTSVELSRVGENGDRTVLRATIRRLRREDGAAAVIVIEDITQQRVADESRDAFVAQATHELRSPLTSIRLSVETLIEDGWRDDLTRGKCLNVITSETRRLERIVGDMLSVAEIEAGSLKLRVGDMRLDTLFEELETDFRPQAEEKDIRLVFELPPKYPCMQGDRDKFVLALHNLISNAIKYTPAGGEVRVRVECEVGRLIVAVTDNGIGIRPEEQDLIFERFYRAKDQRIAKITGSGLGLALARQVIRLHGGDITVRSQIDKGSTFTLMVPLTQEPPARKAA
jgi:two-component system phosphate regulon sensor histidine kinase PhoR